ncbi:hypothetical protein TGFOU_407560, partial [Toxoplasma gondii FOU]
MESDEWKKQTDDGENRDEKDERRRSKTHDGYVTKSAAANSRFVIFVSEEEKLRKEEVRGDNRRRNVKKKMKKSNGENSQLRLLQTIRQPQSDRKNSLEPVLRSDRKIASRRDGKNPP